ncbi:MAG: aminoglycoside phosphotransferase family protein [Actinobacteria bacterium]|nr:aminoglycoside phosphotransferase family protein [Actinomycetota bacterium]
MDYVQGKTCNTAYEDVVREIARQEIAGDASLTPIPTYPDSIVYEVAVDGLTWIFKAMEPNGRDRDGIALEAWSCDRAREAGVPAPRIHLLDTSCSRFPTSFLMMEKASGESLERLALSERDLGSALRELGSLMRALHEIEMPGYGWLDETNYRSEGVARGSSHTWDDALFGTVPESIEYLARTAALSANEIEQIVTLIQRATPLVEPHPASRLLHGDLGLVHVWLDPETMSISSLIDFGERMSGDPVYDFCDLDLEPHLLTYVVGEYFGETPPPEDFHDRVWLYAFARSIPWAMKWHERGHLQVIDWVRHLLRTVPRGPSFSPWP